METFLSLNKEEFKVLLKECLEDLLRTENNSLDSETLLGIDEAAKMLGISKQTLYEKTHKKLIPFFKKGKRIYFDPIEINKWIEGGRIRGRGL